MQAICPECLTPHKLKTSHDNRIRCKKCKTEFLAPVPAVAQNRLVQIRDEQKRLADSFRQEQKRLEEKYAGLNNQLDEAAQKIEALGITGLRDGDYYGLSLALGTADVSLRELVNAYRTLANGGLFTPLNLTPGRQNSPPKRVFQKGVAHICIPR